MCGIVGYARARNASQPLEGAGVLNRMLATLTHRGPDASGTHLTTQVALGHRRLSVIDLTGGAQPMHDPEHGLSIVFNGEIYNYQELNAELAARGYHAQSRSDTETILHAYDAWGSACVEKLNGMFAFAIYDARNGRLFGARDRAGKKPFYYVHDGAFFAFASEPKALLQHPSVRREMDPQAAARYLMYEFVPAPYAIYRGMRKLAGGERFTYELASGRMTVERFWDYRFDRIAANEDKPEAYWIERVQQELLAAVKRRLISDVPLGVFLSGGIDSSAVTAAMVKLMGPGNVKSFAIGFSDKRFDESSHARFMAQHLGTQHFETRLGPDAALEILPQVVALLDEPFADPSILPSYLLSRFARQYVTVALGGDGGDELFAGYDTFKALTFLRCYNAAMPEVVERGVLKPLARMLPVRRGNFSLDFKLKQFMRGTKCPDNERLWRWMAAFVPEEIAGLIELDALPKDAQQGLLDELHALYANVAQYDAVARDSYVFAKTYLADGVLVKVDRATMAFALEARSPLLDRDFIEMAMSIPSRMKVRGGRLKYIFKRALEEMVPREILKRPKKGFGVPVAEWFYGKLRHELTDTLSERKLREGGFLRPKAVQALIDEHLTGKRDNRKPLWTLFMFQRWRDQWLKPVAAPAESAPVTV